MSEERLRRLEEQIAHQERAIADLSDALAAQWTQIEAIARDLRLLRAMVNDLEPRREGPEPPPPHY